MGDLVLTTTGSLSRNRALGVALAQGETLEEYRAAHRSVAEGANTSRAGAALGRRKGVELPIVQKVCEVLFSGKPARRCGAGADGTRTQGGAVAMTTTTRPVQEFYSIGEVCALTDLKPHVLRYWESQFRFLNPAKNRSGNRVYKSREVELIMLVKHLLYTEKYTIDGARQRIDQYRRTGELRVSARKAFEAELATEVRAAIEEVVKILDGRGRTGLADEHPGHQRRRHPRSRDSPCSPTSAGRSARSPWWRPTASRAGPPTR